MANSSEELDRPAHIAVPCQNTHICSVDIAAPKRAIEKYLRPVFPRTIIAGPPAMLGLTVATLAPVLFPGLTSMVTMLVNVEVGLVRLRERLSVMKVIDVVTLGNLAVVELRC